MHAMQGRMDLTPEPVQQREKVAYQPLQTQPRPQPNHTPGFQIRPTTWKYAAYVSNIIAFDQSNRIDSNAY